MDRPLANRGLTWDLRLVIYINVVIYGTSRLLYEFVQGRPPGEAERALFSRFPILPASVCTTTASCEWSSLPSARAVRGWQVHKSGQSPGTGELDDVWQQMINGNYKCHRTCKDDGCIAVASQADCERHAEEAGRRFYSYRPSDKQCAISASCEQPTPALVDWHAFAETTIWPSMGMGSIFCRHSCERDGCAVVASQVECQRRALEAGHSVYFYMEDEEDSPMKECCTFFNIVGPILVGLLFDIFGARNTCLICYMSTAFSQATSTFCAPVVLSYLSHAPMVLQNGYLIAQVLLAQEPAAHDRALSFATACLLYRITWHAPHFFDGVIGSIGQGALLAAGLSVMNALISLRVPAVEPHEVPEAVNSLQQRVTAGGEAAAMPRPEIIGAQDPLRSTVLQGGFLIVDRSPFEVLVSIRKAGFAKIRSVAMNPVIFWLLVVYFLLPLATALAFGDELMASGFHTSTTHAILKEFLREDPSSLPSWNFITASWIAGAVLTLLTSRPLCRLMGAEHLLRWLLWGEICLFLAFALVFNTTFLTGSTCFPICVLAYTTHAYMYYLLKIYIFVLSTSAVDPHERGTILGFTNSMQWLSFNCRLYIFFGFTIRDDIPLWLTFSCAAGITLGTLALLRILVWPRYQSKDA